MSEKRFKLHIIWYDYDKTNGEATLQDNGQPILLSESIDDMRVIKDLLNKLHDENIELQRENKQLKFKKVIENPHWRKYENKSYVGKFDNIDVRFNGDDI